MPPDTCGPRIRELGELLASLEARKADLPEEQPNVDPPSFEAVQEAVEKLVAILGQFEDENVSSLKDMLSRLVPTIEVESGDTVYPAIHLPLVFIMDNWVDSTCHNPKKSVALEGERFSLPSSSRRGERSSMTIF